MAAHYWNPTNYKEPRDILIVKELANPDDYQDLKIDSMDKLLFAVREHYAWEINVRTRFVADDYKWDVDDIVSRIRDIGLMNEEGDKAVTYNQN
jgi:hypothetical protein